MSASQGKGRRILSRTKPAPSRSWISAEWTTTRIGSPTLSTRAWILRPLTRLPASLAHHRCCPLFCGFDRLAVEHCRRRAGLPTHPFAQDHVQLGPDCLPDAITLELAKDVVDRRARRKAVARQITPGAAGARQIENSVHRRPHVGLAWSPAGPV